MHHASEFPDNSSRVLTTKPLQKAGQTKASTPGYIQEKDQMFELVRSSVHALELTSSSFIHISTGENGHG